MCCVVGTCMISFKLLHSHEAVALIISICSEESEV